MLFLPLHEHIGKFESLVLQRSNQATNLTMQRGIKQISWLVPNVLILYGSNARMSLLCKVTSISI